MHDDNFLGVKLAARRTDGAFRMLRPQSHEVDFSSNDYLGIVRNDLLEIPDGVKHGSTGSRLLTGNTTEASILEDQIAAFHAAPAALHHTLN